MVAGWPPRRSWTITAVAVLVVSLADPLGTGTTICTTASDIVIHQAADPEAVIAEYRPVTAARLPGNLPELLLFPSGEQHDRSSA